MVHKVGQGGTFANDWFRGMSFDWQQPASSDIMKGLVERKGLGEGTLSRDVEWVEWSH